MNAQMQTFIVMLMVLMALIYVAIKAKKRLTAKIISCGGCGKCGH